jgi:predicted MPP superfamily phosphohydrolase
MNLLTKIDNYYYNKKPSEVWLMVLLLGLLVGYLIFSLLSTSGDNFRATQEKRNHDLKTQIASHQSYLKAITVNGDRDYYLKDLNRKILQQKQLLNQYRSKLNHLKSSMKELKDLVYTKDNWSKFLHTITQEAKNNHLELYEITSKNYEQNSTFSKVLDVSIKAKGKYGDILSFMNSLEQIKLVTNISNASLNSSESKPVADINLSVWSIKP